VLFLATGIRRRKLAGLALLGILLGNGLCLLAHGPATFLLARSVAGLGAGLTTFAFGSISTFARSARNFAIFSGLSVATMAAADAIIPGLLERAGLAALFGLLAVPAVIALLCSGLLPEETGSSGTLKLPRGAVWRPAALGLLTNLCFFTALAAFWTYAAQIAVAKGNAASRVGQLLAAAFLLGGILGSALAAVTALRVRPGNMIAVGAAVMSATMLIMIWSSGFDQYAASVCVYLLCWFTSYPFLMSLLAEIDPEGGLTVLGVLTQSAGWLIGPALGSVLIAGGRGYGGLGALCASGFLAAMVCALASRLRTYAR
jgi:predicted MFS family arabinose efflux permease